jgi:hypothetical protein
MDHRTGCEKVGEKVVQAGSWRKVGEPRAEETVPAKSFTPSV